MNQPHAGLYKAYSRATHTVNKTRQIVMLYDGAIRFIQQACEAIEQKDYETRYHKLMRAADIFVGLQACLDFDAGGASARSLFDFYAAIDRRMFALHRTNDLNEANALIADIKTMRDVWDKIDRGGEASPAATMPQTPPAGPLDPLSVSA